MGPFVFRVFRFAGPPWFLDDQRMVVRGLGCQLTTLQIGKLGTCCGAAHVPSLPILGAAANAAPESEDSENERHHNKFRVFRFSHRPACSLLNFGCTSEFRAEWRFSYPPFERLQRLPLRVMGPGFGRWRSCPVVSFGRGPLFCVFHNSLLSPWPSAAFLAAQLASL